MTRTTWKTLVAVSLLCGSFAVACSKKERAETNPTVDGYEVVFSEPQKRTGLHKTPAAQQALKAPDAPLVEEPNVPDPHGGEFALDQAVEGLPGDGRLVAEIKTDLGTMTCELYPDRAPRTVANFVGLARGKRGWWDARAGAWVLRPLYDGTTFHRVIPDFMIQGGDSLGNGSGGVGYTIPDELHPSLRHDRAGQLCMANRGPNTNGGQFFITDGAAPHLDQLRSYTIFGQCEPAAVVHRIARVPQAGPPTNRPLTPVHIERVQIRRGT